MNQFHFTLRLDGETTEKTPTYYLYRSEESSGGRPIIDGVYFQRSAFGSTTPETLSIILEWSS